MQCFSVKKSDLIYKDDVSGIKIPITTDSSNKNGTEIRIFTNQQDMDELLSDLSDEKIARKLAASMLDESFNVKIKIENKDKIISTSKLKSFLLSVNRVNFLCEIQFSKEEIEFFHKGINKTPFLQIVLIIVLTSN